MEKKYKWHKLADVGEFLVEEGVIIQWGVPGKDFCLTKKNGQYFAFQSKCPHAGASFDQGWLDENGCLVCPLHRFRFDLANGRNVSGEGFSLVRFPIDENEHGIWIGIPGQEW
jgi:nitrite reductase/ring-hydroxylating ferredoxin subunit